MSSLSQEEEQLVSMANHIYRSQTTETIHQATHNFVNHMVNKYPNSFTQVERLITKKDAIPLNTRKALISLYKASAQQILRILQDEAFLNSDSLGSYKKVLHTVEHAFDNNSIDSEIKYPIEVAYIKVFVFFSAQNHERLISKSKYYFNTKEDLLALSLLELYHTSDSPFKHKVQYYPACLLTLMTYLQKKLDKLYENKQEINSDFMMKLSKHIQVLHHIWTSLTFQVHQSTFISLMREGNFVKIWQQLLGNQFPRHLLHYVYDIAEYILASLIRCKLLLNFPDLIDIYKELGLRELQFLMEHSSPHNWHAQDNQLQIARIKYLIACSDASYGKPVLELNIPLFDLFSKLIYPNYKIIRTYLDKHSNNCSEIENFLEDLSFQMKSQCLQVLIHKLIMTICKNNNEMQGIIKAMVTVFLFKYLPSISSGEIKEVQTLYVNSFVLEFWSRVNAEVSQHDQILSMLLFTAIGVDLFLPDMKFLSDLNNFVSINSEFLWSKNPEITFYTLLIYKNYKADIFSNNKASGFKLKLINTVLSKGTESLIRSFSISIIQEQFDSKPPYDTVFFTVQYLFHQLVKNFDPKLITIVLVLFKHYRSRIAELQPSVPLIGVIYKLVDKHIREGGSLTSIAEYFEILQIFLEIKVFQTHFPELILNLVQLSEIAQPKTPALGDQFASIMSKGLQILGELPPNYQQILMQYKWHFQQIDQTNHFTTLIRASSNITFINWLLEQQIYSQFTIESCLLIHSIIYYQGTKLYPEVVQALIKKIYRYRICHRVGINYISGKLNLVLLMLIKRNRTQLHQIFYNQSWINFQNHIHQEFQLQLQFSSKQIQKNHRHYDQDQTYLFNDHHHLPFIDAIYHFIYVDQHVYCWKYDITVFLICQIQIMLTELQEEQQLKYANVSIVAVLRNVLRAEQFRTCQLQEESDSEDEQLITLSEPYDREHLLHKSICQKYNIPLQFTQNYLPLFNKLITRFRSEKSSRQWLTTIIDNVFSRQQKYQIQQILNSQQCNGGKVRRILKVKDVKIDREQYLVDNIV